MSKICRKQQKMCRTIIIISFLFMIFTLPTASIQGEVYVYLNSFDVGKLIILLCNSTAYTYQASTFLLLYLTNNIFSKEAALYFSELNA
jgi:hypothetical protein